MITVLLSLILCAVLAVVGTGVELSRIEIGKSMAARAFHVSLESLLGEYSLQVFRRYHLFLLDSGFGGEEEKDGTLISHIKEDIENTFAPDRNINQWNPLKLKSFNMLGLKLNHLSITNKTTILDEEGELFVNEAVGYMKYAVKPEEVDELIKKISPFSEVKDSVAVINETIKAEQKMAKLDYSYMNFIQLVEGLSIKKNQFQLKKNGMLETEDYFVKTMCPEEVTMDNVGIQNTVIWNSLKYKYSNPVQLLDSIKQYVNIKNVETKKIERLQKEIESLREVSSDSEESAESLMQSIEKKYKEINNAEKRQNNAEKSLKKSYAQINGLLRNVKQKNKEAIEMIPKLLDEQKNYAEVLLDYEKKLNGYLKDGDPKLYNNLMKELEQKKAYANGGIPCMSGKKIEEVEITLKNNFRVIEEAERLLSDFDFSLTAETEINNKISALTQIFRQYDTKSLSFSYGEISVKKPENPIDNIKKLIQEGILDLVIEDTTSLSKKVLSSKQLVSSATNDMGNTKPDFNDKDEFPNIDFDIFSSFSDFKNDIVRTILMGNYFAKHFNMAVNMLNKSEKKDKETMTEVGAEANALDYELEYLINGKKEDRGNLLAAINKILLVRTVCNFIYLYTDAEASGKANATAAGLVGFTCFGPLITLTKTLIIIAWSYAEGLVDTSALLQGYSVPLIKNKGEFKVRYEELIGIQKTTIRNKSAEWKEMKTGVTYDDYMQFLLLLVPQKIKCYRALDLIQENINMSEKEHIDMNNALFGLEIRGECSVSVKFLKIPFIGKIVGAKQNQYSFTVDTDSAY